MRNLWFVVVLLGACGSGSGATPGGGDAEVADASTSCWQYECPFDAGAAPCGTCKHHFSDMECPPGFVCDCLLNCVKGPRGPDGGICLGDAGVIDGGPDAAPDSPDAHVFDWPVCDTSVPPPN
jgi:hypothetical protein